MTPEPMTDPQAGRTQSIVRRAPSAVVVVCLTVVVLAVIATVGALSYAGRDASGIMSLVNTGLNFAGVLLGGSALVLSGTAARSAVKAEDALNGQLDARIEQAVGRALRARKNV